MADCSNRRSTFDIAPRPPATSLALLARRHVFAIEIAPALPDAPDHAHGGDRFGVAPARLHQRVARRRELGGGAGRPPRLQFGEHRERDQNDRAGERGQSEIGMKHEADDQVDRHPRQIEQRHRADAGQKAAHRVEVANRLRAFGPAAGFQRQPHDGVIDAHAHRLVEAVADAHQDAAADRFDGALRRIEAGDQDHQRDQRRHAAARQHAIVDFQHEQRAGEHQQIAHAAEHADGDESLPARNQRRGKFGTCRRLAKRTEGWSHQGCVPPLRGLRPLPRLQKTGRGCTKRYNATGPDQERRDHHTLS